MQHSQELILLKEKKAVESEKIRERKRRNIHVAPRAVYAQRFPSEKQSVKLLITLMRRQIRNLWIFELSCFFSSDFHRNSQNNDSVRLCPLSATRNLFSTHMTPRGGSEFSSTIHG